MKNPLLSLFRYWPLLLLWINVSCKVSQKSKEEHLPHIVMLLVDDMGYGDLSSYNAESKISTPHLDRLAGEGMIFTDAHAAGPLCHMSRYGLLTGSYPFRTDVSVWPKQPLIEKEQITLPGMLKSRGYHTAMVGKWHLGFQEEGYDKALRGGPVDRGFDEFFGIRASTDIPPYFYIKDSFAVKPPTRDIKASSSEGWSPIQGEFWRAGKIATDMELIEVLPRFTREAVAVIENHHKKSDGSPLFLYVALPSPHTPWLPTTAYEGKSAAGMYGDFLMMVDNQIGQVIEALKANGMYDNTLLMFSSDNGPVWYEEDAEQFGHDSAGELRGMKGDAWEAGHRVPFIVRWPGKVKAGTVSEKLIAFTDVISTLAYVSGTPEKTGALSDSHSFYSAIIGDSTAENTSRAPWVMQSASGAMVIRSGNWKLINQLGSGGFSKPKKVEPGPGDPPGQLYNMAEDPREENNLYLERPEVVERLLEEMKAIVEAG